MLSKLEQGGKTLFQMPEKPLQGPVWNQYVPILRSLADQQIKGPKANLDKSDVIYSHMQILDS